MSFARFGRSIPFAMASAAAMPVKFRAADNASKAHHSADGSYFLNPWQSYVEKSTPKLLLSIWQDSEVRSTTFAQRCRDIQALNERLLFTEERTTTS